MVKTLKNLKLDLQTMSIKLIPKMWTGGSMGKFQTIVKDHYDKLFEIIESLEARIVALEKK